MNRVINSLYRGFKLIQQGHYKIFGEQLLTRLYSRSTTIGFRRNMETEFKVPKSSIDIRIRLFENGDLNFLLEHGEIAKTNPRQFTELTALIAAGIPKCYLAVTTDGKPCFIQWLFGSDQNERLQKFYSGLFPILEPNEALLEGAYMHRSYRGLGIMPAAIDRILNIEKRSGMQQVLTFVDLDNIPSLKGIKRAGFTPYIMRKDRWLLFRQYVSFLSIPDEILNIYEERTADYSVSLAIST